jgi:hypothetical protein
MAELGKVKVHIPAGFRYRGALVGYGFQFQQRDGNGLGNNPRQEKGRRHRQHHNTAQHRQAKPHNTRQPHHQGKENHDKKRD